MIHNISTAFRTFQNHLKHVNVKILLKSQLPFVPCFPGVPCRQGSCESPGHASSLSGANRRYTHGAESCIDRLWYWSWTQTIVSWTRHSALLTIFFWMWWHSTPLKHTLFQCHPTGHSWAEINPTSCTCTKNTEQHRAALLANFFPSNALNRSGQAPTIVKTLHQRTFLVMIWCIFESIVNLESLKDGNCINMKQYCTSMKQFELQALNLHVALISCFAANFRTEFVGSTATCVEKVDHSRLEKSTRTAPVTRSPHLHAIKHVLVRALDTYPFPCYEGLLPKSVYSNASPRKGRIQGALQLADRVVDNRPSLQIGFWGFLAVLAEYEIFSRNLFAVYVFFPTRTLHTPFLIRCIVCILPFSTVEEQAGCKVATTLTFQQVCHIHCWSHVLAQRLVLAFCRFSCWPWESSAASLVSSLTAWIAMVL